MESHEAYVYLIRLLDIGDMLGFYNIYKIGFSKNPEIRFYEDHVTPCLSSLYGKIEVKCLFKSPWARDIEYSLHKKFAEKHWLNYKNQFNQVEYEFEYMHGRTIKVKSHTLDFRFLIKNRCTHITTHSSEWFCLSDDDVNTFEKTCEDILQQKLSYH